MKKIALFVFAISVFLSGCATSGKISKTRNFSITADTPIAVHSPSDPSLAAAIEGELLGLGLKVVPYETAASVVTTNSKITLESKSISGTQSSSDFTYIPASVVISTNLKFKYYPAATYFLGGNIRVLDMNDKKLIANFNYQGSEWTIGNSDDIVRLFIRDFANEIGM